MKQRTLITLAIAANVLALAMAWRDEAVAHAWSHHNYVKKLEEFNWKECK